MRGGREVKYRDVIAVIEKDGWRMARPRGSHLQFRHATKPGTVTVSAGGHLNRDVPPGTLNSILKQAGLK
jgi:predicted RNA binding protein YcfA (HicA-like mRNA interferase family)